MEDLVLIQQIWFVRHGNTPPHKLPNVSKGSLSNKYVLGFFIKHLRFFDTVKFLEFDCILTQI